MGTYGITKEQWVYVYIQTYIIVALRALRKMYIYVSRRLERRSFRLVSSLT